MVETVDRSSAGKGYAATAVRVPWYLPAFTRRREVCRNPRTYARCAVHCTLPVAARR